MFVNEKNLDKTSDKSDSEDYGALNDGIASGTVEKNSEQFWYQ